ncbi:MAG: beta-lactamase family protein [Actinomycetota bacterium]|nr:beta-lactamase family protein [Actinomycetota bacterium]
MGLTALEAVRSWPVPDAAAAVVAHGGSVLGTVGDVDRPFRLASLSKMITAWAALIAVEEGVIGLDAAVGQPGCTLRHVLCHAGGYPFEGEEPVAAPARRRIYSNTGIELAATAVAAAADIPFADYLSAAVLEPLAMGATDGSGSPAHAFRSSAADLARFLAEVQQPTLLDAATAAEAVSPQFPDLAGIVPAVGRFDPCPWGLGFEIRGEKSPHWTGCMNSPSTYGHFGGAGTMFWVDPDAGCGLVALTNRSFDDWSVEALRCWRTLSDGVLAEVAG